MRQEIRNRFQGHAVNIDRLIQLADYLALNSQNPRNLAKKKMINLVGKVAQATGNDEIQIRRKFYRTYTKYKYGNAIGDLRALLGPVFNAR